MILKSDSSETREIFMSENMNRSIKQRDIEATRTLKNVYNKGNHEKGVRGYNFPITRFSQKWS